MLENKVNLPFIGSCAKIVALGKGYSKVQGRRQRWKQPLHTVFAKRSFAVEVYKISIGVIDRADEK